MQVLGVDPVIGSVNESLSIANDAVKPFHTIS